MIDLANGNGGKMVKIYLRQSEAMFKLSFSFKSPNILKVQTIVGTIAP